MEKNSQVGGKLKQTKKTYIFHILKTRKFVGRETKDQSYIEQTDQNNFYV